MEKIENRKQYLNNFKNFSKKVKLSEIFIQKLRKHQLFADYVKALDDFDSNEEMKEIKVFILTELTRERDTCNAIIDLLRETKQKDAAKELQKYNTSSGLLVLSKLSLEEKIGVNRAMCSKTGSRPYPMLRNPRGKFIIVNNIPDLQKESKRFQYVFNELYFTPIAFENLSANQIQNELEKVSNDPSLENENAFIFMIISHGRDERVLGFNGCQQSDDNDFIKMSDIVKIFSTTNCEKLNKKPKIFIFDCCRIQEEMPSVKITSMSSEKQTNCVLSDEMEIEYQTEHQNEKLNIKFKFDDIRWDNENEDTFVIYSCSEGEASFYSQWLGMTAFGQSFSHSIAHYSCQESLLQVMTRTCTLMDQFKGKGFFSRPEHRELHVRNELYFNVGHHNQRH